MVVTKAQAFMCLLRVGPLRKLWRNNSTDKLEVEMLPHLAEGHVKVLIDDPAVWTEGELPAPSFEAERLPHEACVMVEVT